MAFDPNKALVQDSTIQPLSRDAFIDPTTGAERPINNPVTNPINYASDVAKQEQNAIINRKIDAIAHDTTLTPEARQTQMANLQNQKTGMTGITPEMRAQIVAERNLPQNQYVPVRDIQAEQKNASKFGLDTTNPADVVSGLTTTYNTPQINKILLNGEVNTSAFSSQNLKDLGLTEDRINQLIKEAKTPEEKARIQDLYKKLQDTGAAGAQAESVMNATPALTNSKLDILSEALNAKSNYKNQALGTSDLFKVAGLSGYSVLAQSLNQRMNEMQDKSKSAQNLIAETGSKMVSAYKAISDNYNQVLKEYNAQMQMLLKIDQDAKDHEQALDLARQQDELSRKTYEWRKQVDQRYSNDKWTHISATENQPAGRFNTTTGEFIPDEVSTGNADSTNKTGWNKLTTQIKDIFYQPGKSDYGHGEGKRECGEAANDITNGVKVGNSYASKMAAVTKRNNPQVGNELVIPLNVKDNKKDPGHIEVITLLDKANDTIQTVSWNRDLKGSQTTQTYKISDLNKKYGTNWGFTDSTLKTKYQKGLDQVTEEENPIMSAAKLGYSAGSSSGSAAAGLIGAATGAVAGAVGEVAPKTDMVEELYNAVGTASGKLEARDPKSSMRKRFDAMTREQQQKYIEDLKTIQETKNNDMQALLDQAFGK